MNMSALAKLVEVGQMTDSLCARLQNNIVNKFTALYNFEHTE